MLFCEASRICYFMSDSLKSLMSLSGLLLTCKSYALHVVIHMHLSFPPPTDSSCQKQRLTLLRFRQRRQLQLSNAELPECRARSAATPYWAAFSKRSPKVPPVKQPVKMVLAASVFSTAKDRRQTPAMQMKPTYIQRPLCLPWLWRRSRWMWRSHLSRTWSQSKWRMLARTVSALVLRRHIALHQQKMWSPSSKVWPPVYVNFYHRPLPTWLTHCNRLVNSNLYFYAFFSFLFFFNHRSRHKHTGHQRGCIDVSHGILFNFCFLPLRLLARLRL